MLRGPTVELRATNPDTDAADLFAALDRDEVWTHVRGRPADPEELAAVLRFRAEAGWFGWTVRLRVPLAGFPVGAVVGTTSFLEVSGPDARAEIGATSYTPSLWGSVVNPECKLLLLSYAFEELGFGRVQLKTDIRNLRSQRAIARLGASFEGVLRRYQRRADGTVRDTLLFSITAEDWPRVREGLIERLRVA